MHNFLIVVLTRALHFFWWSLQIPGCGRRENHHHHHHHLPTEPPGITASRAPRLSNTASLQMYHCHMSICIKCSKCCTISQVHLISLSHSFIFRQFSLEDVNLCARGNYLGRVVWLGTQECPDNFHLSDLVIIWHRCFFSMSQ